MSPSQQQSVLSSPTNRFNKLSKSANSSSASASASASASSTSSASSSPSKNRNAIEQHSNHIHALNHLAAHSAYHSHSNQLPSSPSSPSQLSSNPQLYCPWSPSSLPIHRPSLNSPAPSTSNTINNHSHTNNLHSTQSQNTSREGRSNSHRRSSNAGSLRHQQQQQQQQQQQHQQQQAQARAHAHVQAHVQAQVHAHLQAQAQAQAQHLSYYQQHMADLASYITQVFLPSVLPTPEEYQVKEQTRQYLETLADKVSKGARLLPFGSIASGLALRNSDMDLCCLMEPANKAEKAAEERAGSESGQAGSSEPTTANEDPQGGSSSASGTSEQPKPKPSPAEMVMILGKLIQEETAFMVKMLPKARIPIIKLSLPPSPGQPFGLTCDIGFENRLALENTRLLLTYAMVDPRMRTMVLFLKVWTKRRRINDPYLGTLSSYGYVLMVIYYLVNGRKAAVLPNLQQLPPPRVTPPEELVYEGHDIYFFDDLDALPRYWTGMNRENVGELLIEFFRFFSTTFRYTHDVISVRSPCGLLSKESKGWMHDIIEEGKDGRGGYSKVDLNRLCIEDPFQTNYNVARTVTRDGLFTIRGEFMRAVRVLSTRSDRLDVMIRELCEERQEGVLMAPPSSSGRRKSAPNPKASMTMSLSGSASSTLRMTSDPNEEDEDELEEQLLLQQQQQQQQQQATYSNEPQQPSYPPLTTRLMQDHIYSQATSSMDARPRYPPESIASEPPPLDRDMDWNHESISSYLSNEIQQLQLQQQQPLHPRAFSHPVTNSCESSKPLNPSSSCSPAAPVTAHYFHRFFQTPGTDPTSSQPSTSSSLRNSSSLTSSPGFVYDIDGVDKSVSISPTSLPKPLGGEPPNRPDGCTPGFSQDDFGLHSTGISPPSGSSAVRYTTHGNSPGRAPRSISHSSVASRRRSELPQPSMSLLTASGAPIVLAHASNSRIPDFSALPVPGPIRFGNFGTAEKLLKQKLESQQRMHSGNHQTGYHGHPNGFTSFPHDVNGRNQSQYPRHDAGPHACSSRWQEVRRDPAEDERWQPNGLAADQRARKRSLSNGASSHSGMGFEQFAKPPPSTSVAPGEGVAGVETPRAKASRSPAASASTATRMLSGMRNGAGSTGGSGSGHSSRGDRLGSEERRQMSPSSSLAQLPRKIVFGDVEVSTEEAKEVRVKALAAVLRTRRMGSLQQQTQTQQQPQGEAAGQAEDAREVAEMTRRAQDDGRWRNGEERRMGSTSSSVGTEKAICRASRSSENPGEALGETSNGKKASTESGTIKAMGSITTIPGESLSSSSSSLSISSSHSSSSLSESISQSSSSVVVGVNRAADLGEDGQVNMGNNSSESNSNSSPVVVVGNGDVLVGSLSSSSLASSSMSSSRSSTFKQNS